MTGKETVLVTGGAGYIGSHTVLELLNAGYQVICVDNMCNAFIQDGDNLPESLRRVQNITGKKVTFLNVDIRDADALRDEVFGRHKIDCVAHFAALRAVGESCRLPLQYYQNNITGTSVLLEASYADPKLAEVELGWRAERGVDKMCEDAWRWQKSNPNGFATTSQIQPKI